LRGCRRRASRFNSSPWGEFAGSYSIGPGLGVAYDGSEEEDDGDLADSDDWAEAVEMKIAV